MAEARIRLLFPLLHDGRCGIQTSSGFWLAHTTFGYIYLKREALVSNGRRLNPYYLYECVRCCDAGCTNQKTERSLSISTFKRKREREYDTKMEQVNNNITMCAPADSTFHTLGDKSTENTKTEGCNKVFLMLSGDDNLRMEAPKMHEPVFRHMLPIASYAFPFSFHFNSINAACDHELNYYDYCVRLLFANTSSSNKWCGVSAKKYILDIFGRTYAFTFVGYYTLLCIIYLRRLRVIIWSAILISLAHSTHHSTAQRSVSLSISNHRNRTVDITSAYIYIYMRSFISSSPRPHTHAHNTLPHAFNEVKSLYHPLQSILCSLFIPNSIKEMEQIIEIPRIWWWVCTVCVQLNR